MNFYENQDHFSLDRHSRHETTSIYKKCANEVKCSPYKYLLNYTYTLAHRPDSITGKISTLDFIVKIQIPVLMRLVKLASSDHLDQYFRYSLYRYSYKKKHKYYIIYKKMPIKLGMLRDVDFRRV